MRGGFYILRHGETVFNAAGRMQGEAVHTPLTRAGFAQADAMGAALKARLGTRPPLALWVSPAGRALQTLAIVAEHLGLDWAAARIDPRLAEMDMGAWGGRLYSDIAAESGPFVDRERALFTRTGPGGEWYDGVAARLAAWLDETGDGGSDRLVVMHGMSSRILRALLTGAEPAPGCNAPVAGALPQGSIACVQEGTETILHCAGATAAAPA